jgi:flagellar biosynthesis protein FliQ
MTDSSVLELAQRAMTIVGMLCAPVLVFGLVVGLLVSVFQAATQIQEMSLTFVPKIIVCGIALILFGPWMLRSLINFTTKIFLSLPSLIK